MDHLLSGGALMDIFKLVILGWLLGTLSFQLPNIASKLTTIHYDLVKISNALQKD